MKKLILIVIAVMLSNVYASDDKASSMDCFELSKEQGVEQMDQAILESFGSKSDKIKMKTAYVGDIYCKKEEKEK